MVSLSRSANTNVGGATFFSESTNMEDREYLQPILESFGVFTPLTTIIPFSIHLIVFALIEIMAIIFMASHPNGVYDCRGYYALLYSHVAFWFLTLIVDQIARVKHYNLRMNGYLEFYRKTQTHHQLPFYIVSMWTAVVLLLQTLMQQFYIDFRERCTKGGLLSPISYMCIILSVEFCVILAVSVNYIVLVHKFNKLKPPPDVQKEEWNACSSAETFAQGEIGYRQLGDKVYDFIEKQADLIRHLKDHNARLGEKLMIVTAQIQAKTRITNISTTLPSPTTAKEKVAEPKKLVCPGKETRIPFFALPCKKSKECMVWRRDFLCCFSRCVKGVTLPEPEPSHLPLFGVIDRVCPVDPMPELLSVQECVVDDDCGQRICCPEKNPLDGSVKNYCRNADHKLTKTPVIRQLLLPLKPFMGYVQCTSPPPFLDLFPKPCESPFDCFPNLCCQENGKKVCRPPKRSLLTVLISVTQNIGTSGIIKSFIQRIS
ncbi:hypothetical protein FQA39_LY09865 [Lamprigera yunnana]|nr:hypothetical protein FQA39_LY09865 [Lamprigera yunnana]